MQMRSFRVAEAVGPNRTAALCRLAHDQMERKTTMRTEGDLVPCRDETLRKIGRNIVLFQQLEGVLKFLASTQYPSMPLSKAEATRDERADFIGTRTLGQVAGDVVRALYAECGSASSAPNVIVEPWLSFSFRIDSDPVSVEESRKALEALIDERNDLVHHLMPRWNFQDAESCRALSDELDEQRHRIHS